MEFEYKDNTIRFEKEPTIYDKFTLKFVRVLDKLNVPYVLIAGYIAILFGRPRNTEDIDIFLPRLTQEQIHRLYDALEKDGFWCLNTSKNDAYEYLAEGTGIRFALKDAMEPNMEVKFAKRDIDNYSLQNKITVYLNNEKLYISPIELQISYKLLLGSDKDLEDAAHMWAMFKKQLDIKTLKYFLHYLRIKEDVIHHALQGYLR